MRNNLKIKYCLFTLIAMINLPYMAISQEIKVYKGLIEGDKAKYEYYEKNGERIYHGEFIIIKDKSQGNINYNFKVLEITKCKYEHGNITGEYVIEDITFLPSFRFAVPVGEDEFYIAKVTNNNEINYKRITKKHYVNGKINGPFSYEEIHYKNAKTTNSNHEKIESNIKENYFFGNYTHSVLKNGQKHITIDGKFDTNGFLIGEWNFKIEGKKEVRIYGIGQNKGHLLSLKSINEETGKIIQSVNRYSYVNFKNLEYFSKEVFPMKLSNQIYNHKDSYGHNIYYPKGYKDDFDIDYKIGKPLIAMLSPRFAEPKINGLNFKLNIKNEDNFLIYDKKGNLNPYLWIGLKKLYIINASSSGGVVPELENKLKTLLEKQSIQNWNIGALAFNEVSKDGYIDYSLDSNTLSYNIMFNKYDIFDTTQILLYNSFLTDLKKAYYDINPLIDIFNYCFYLKKITGLSELKNTEVVPQEFSNLYKTIISEKDKLSQEMSSYYIDNSQMQLIQFNQFIKEKLPELSVKINNIIEANKIIETLNTIKAELWQLETEVFNGIKNDIYFLIIKPSIDKYTTNPKSYKSGDLTNALSYLEGLRQIYLGYTVEYKKSSTSMLTTLPSKENKIQEMVTYKGKSYKKAFEDNTTNVEFK
ncbi:MAG: hypothetical protein RQ875_13225 [Vicingaceae bacterium]|nr:hypothetical protein [Vicingaceae bacterium]